MPKIFCSSTELLEGHIPSLWIAVHFPWTKQMIRIKPRPHHQSIGVNRALLNCLSKDRTNGLISFLLACSPISAGGDSYSRFWLLVPSSPPSPVLIKSPVSAKKTCTQWVKSGGRASTLAENQNRFETWEMNVYNIVCTYCMPLICILHIYIYLQRTYIYIIYTYDYISISVYGRIVIMYKLSG